MFYFFKQCDELQGEHMSLACWWSLKCLVDMLLLAREGCIVSDHHMLACWEILESSLESLSLQCPVCLLPASVQH